MKVIMSGPPNKIRVQQFLSKSGGFVATRALKIKLEDKIADDTVDEKTVNEFYASGETPRSIAEKRYKSSERI